MKQQQQHHLYNDGAQQQHHLYNNVQMWRRCACSENWFGVHSAEFFQDILNFPPSFHHLPKHLIFEQIWKVKSLHLPIFDSPLPICDSPANVQSSHFENAANGQAVIYLHRIVGGLMIPKFSSCFCIQCVAISFNPDRLSNERGFFSDIVDFSKTHSITPWLLIEAKIHPSWWISLLATSTL